MYKVLDGEVGSSGTKAGSALSAHVAVSKNAITQSGIYSVTSILILRVEPEIFEVLDSEKIMVGKN